VQAGELWRLLTSLFVHTGLLHLANNMIILVLLGILVERTFGTGWFAGVYLTTGLASGLASILWHADTVSAGASGCLFGVAGFGLALLLVKRKRFSGVRPMLLKTAGVFLGINLVIGAVMPGVDLVAHVAGFVCGSIIGLIASPAISDREKPRAGVG
jgi:rhomboid protease GluP